MLQTSAVRVRVRLNARVSARVRVNVSVRVCSHKPMLQASLKALWR